jgi:hypothetical protein
MMASQSSRHEALLGRGRLSTKVALLGTLFGFVASSACGASINESSPSGPTTPTIVPVPPTTTSTVTTLTGPSTSVTGTPQSTTSSAPTSVTTWLPSGSWGGIRTAADGGFIVAFTGSPPVASNDPCFTEYEAVVDESPDLVRVNVQARQFLAGDSQVPACAAVGAARFVRFELADPLGTRALVGMGAPRTAFDGTLLAEPRDLPEGWGVVVEEPGSDPSTSPAYWTRTWGDDLAIPPGPCSGYPGGAIRLHQGDEGMSALDDIRVVGEPLDVSLADGSIPATRWPRSSNGGPVLVWSTNQQRFVAEAIPDCDGDDVVSAELLDTFAEGVLISD